MVGLGNCLLLDYQCSCVTFSLQRIYFFDYPFADDTGKTYGFFMTGQGIFILIIVLVNFKILSFANSYSPLLIFSLVASVALAILTWFLIGLLDFGLLEHTFSRILGKEEFWVLLFILIGVATFDWAVTKLFGRLLSEHRTNCDERIRCSSI
jgi:hypothetical protein